MQQRRVKKETKTTAFKKKYKNAVKESFKYQTVCQTISFFYCWIVKGCTRRAVLEKYIIQTITLLHGPVRGFHLVHITTIALHVGQVLKES